MLKIVMVPNPITKHNDWAIEDYQGETLISREVLPATQIQSRLDHRFNITRD